MMRRLRHASFAGLLLAATSGAAGVARATPSSTYWTPMTPDLQPHGVLHVGVDNYFKVSRKANTGGGAFPTDAGLTVGLLPFTRFQLEVGVDLFEPSDDPVFFNAKAGSPEGALWKGSPALQLGIFNAGTRRNITDQDIVYIAVGKSLGGIGRLSVGPYVGNGAVLRNEAGEKANTGFMLAFDRGFAPSRDAELVAFNRLVLAADYASGENALGGGGAGLYYYIHPDVSLLFGPVWFNEEAINGNWKWTIQLDINRRLSSR